MLSIFMDRDVGDVSDPNQSLFCFFAVAAIFLIVLAAAIGTWIQVARQDELRRIRQAVERQSADSR